MNNTDAIELLRAMGNSYRKSQRAQDIAGAIEGTLAEVDRLNARVAELESLVEFPDEWGVRFVDEDGQTEDPALGDAYATREPAEQVVRLYVDARLVKRTSFRGAWVQVEPS